MSTNNYNTFSASLKGEGFGSGPKILAPPKGGVNGNNQYNLSNVFVPSPNSQWIFPFERQADILIENIKTIKHTQKGAQTGYGVIPDKKELEPIAHAPLKIKSFSNGQIAQFNQNFVNFASDKSQLPSFEEPKQDGGSFLPAGRRVRRM